MIDTHTQTLLQAVLRRECRSVLRYVAEAYPWATVNEEKALAALQQIIADERAAVTHLGQFLVRRRVPLPFLPSYPAGFTTINFLAFDYVVPRLAEYERQSIAELEHDLVAVKESAARAELEHLLTVKRRHLPQLESLVSAQPQASLT